MLEQDAMTWAIIPFPMVCACSPNDPWIQQDDRSFIVQGKQRQVFIKWRHPLHGLTMGSAWRAGSNGGKATSCM